MSVQDLYPESLVAQRRIRAGSPLFRLLRSADKAIARGSDALIVISRHFAEVYRTTRSVQAECLHVVPNWNINTPVLNFEKDPDFRQRLGIPADAFVVLYGGNIGMAADVESVISAFDILRNLSHIHLVVAGAGPNLAACRDLAVRLALERVHFYSPWPADETSAVLLSADLLVLPSRGKQTFASVPSKLIAYIFASRPVLALAMPESPTAEVVSSADCGWVIRPGDPELLAAELREISRLETVDLSSMGRSGYEYALKHFGREANVEKVIQILDTVASAPD
jgi:colanic acid biosynthesis glycosyl transferase WcaI